MTEAGLRTNVSVGIQYLESWLRGIGAAAINNLMEDAATAEICRAQVWQWCHHGVRHGRRPDGHARPRPTGSSTRRLAEARGPRSATRPSAPGPSTRPDDLFERVALGDPFAEFLTLPAYRARSTEDGRRPCTNQATTMAGRQSCGARAASGRATPAGRASGATTPPADVVRCAARCTIEHTLARTGAERLWRPAPDRGLRPRPGRHDRRPGRADGAGPGCRRSTSAAGRWRPTPTSREQVYPDQSLYPANSVPSLVRRINNALRRADQIEWAEEGSVEPPLDGADRGRRRGRLRRAAQRLRADEVDDRGRRGGRPLRGPAGVGEEVRPHGRQGAGADRASTSAP